MSQRCRSAIDSLAAPKQSGGVLIWPKESFDNLAARNRTALAACKALLNGRTISSWRSSLSGPLRIMTGHQPAFFHAGVWAKNIAAVACGGEAVFLVVDSDQSQGAALAWPEQENGFWKTREALAAPGARSLSFEQLPEISDATAIWNSIPADLRRSTLVIDFEKAYANSPAPDHVSRWIHAMIATGQSMGVGPIRYERLSKDFALARNDAAAAFVAEIILNARRFAADYNAALSEFRKCRGIPGHEHPVPDLLIEQDRCEVPFWLLREGLPRQRMFIATESTSRITLYAGRDRFCEIDAARLAKTPDEVLRDCPARIRPRALGTMLYARLLASDLFIHGIGGAKYDQITDAIIRRYFRTEPPLYACVTATLRLPLKHTGLDPAEETQARRRLRDIRFNPQRFPDHVASAEVLVQREAAIAESQRLRTETPRRRDLRRAVYDRIQSANAAALRDPEALSKKMRDSFAEMEARAASDKVADSREWFWCLHQRAALDKLIEEVRGQLKH
ncbi:MAG TPA: hypothetical protein VMV81_02675 [Phycisphaerae bacterium]|nr:hypothetical protein [Phycisphaerae bacterium]